MASVLSLACILAWKDGMDDWTATEERKTESKTLIDTSQQKRCPCVYLVCRPSPGAWRRSGSLCVEKPICPSESPAASVTATTQQTHLNKHGHTTTTPSRAFKQQLSISLQYFVLSVGHGAVKRPLLKLEVVHVQLLCEHAARGHRHLRGRWEEIFDLYLFIFSLLTM